MGRCPGLFFFQAEDGIRDVAVTGVQTCALPISYDLGSGPLATFRQVTLPRLMPAILAAALLSFTFSFDDYVLPAFTNGTTNTWPIVLFSAVRFGLTPAVNALATIMLGATMLAITITAVILRRSRVQA